MTAAFPLVLLALTAHVSARDAGVLYEVWHTPSALAMQEVIAKGGRPLTVETVIRSNGSLTLDDVFQPYNVSGKAATTCIVWTMRCCGCDLKQYITELPSLAHAVGVQIFARLHVTTSAASTASTTSTASHHSQHSQHSQHSHHIVFCHSMLVMTMMMLVVGRQHLQHAAC